MESNPAGMFSVCVILITCNGVIYTELSGIYFPVNNNTATKMVCIFNFFF